MAYTIPTGYTYYDASASKTYTAGEIFSGTPAAGDTFQGTSSSVKGIVYYYYNARTVAPVTKIAGDPDISISAGWALQLYNHTGTATSHTVLTQIAGKNTVHVVAYSESSKINTLNFPSTSQVEYISIAQGNQHNISTIQGYMTSSLKYFSACNNANLVSVPSFSNCTNWTYGFNAFYNCTKLTTAPALPTSLTNIRGIFQNCTSLTTATAIPSSATDATYAYYNCAKLTAAPQNNSSSLTSLTYCFQGCTSLTTAANFTINGTINLNADSIFYGCTNLVTPPKITRVKSLRRAFYDCSKLTSLPTSLPSTVTDVIFMCHNCSSLTNFPDMSATSITDLQSSFYIIDNNMDETDGKKAILGEKSLLSEEAKLIALKRQKKMETYPVWLT